MRIAFLCKRRYMGKDVIADRYARLYEIPHQLARHGHTVYGFCLSYQGHDEGTWEHAVPQGKLVWESRSLGELVLPRLLAYPWLLKRRLSEFAPDLIIGASDIPQVALGDWVARKLDVPYAADLYDNFESFGQARIPGFVGALRRAVRRAALVTTTSEPLRRLVVESYGAKGEIIAMPSTVDKTVFRPLERAASRRALGLPLEAKLVGTAGGLHRDKGVDALYAAWSRIAAEHPDAELVLAGPIDKAFPPPTCPRVRYLGMLPHARTAELFSALDVGVIYLRDTAFGRYCFPQKAYEMMACKLPIAAARVGVMTHLLEDAPDALYRPDDAADLARAVSAQLESPLRPAIAIDDWATVIGAVEPKLRSLVPSKRAA
ncbi:MAG TPA: glycosyltransferase family 4 protein [Gammaproteobacteria bacterium]|nr:glycosyltransferase family 4 protein [Gammaproteobacteria bacterium]